MMKIVMFMKHFQLSTIIQSIENLKTSSEQKEQEKSTFKISRKHINRTLFRMEKHQIYLKENQILKSEENFIVFYVDKTTKKA